MTSVEFPHHMIREIHEEPRVVKAALKQSLNELQEIVNDVNFKRYGMIYITGSGTSYHAGLAGQYALSALTRFVPSLIPASELPSWLPPTVSRKALLIAISQSGEGSDILNAAKAALNKKMDILAVTNTLGSSLMKMARHTILTRAGEELAVTATKSYVAQLAAIFLLSLGLAMAQESEVENLAQLRRKLLAAPDFIMKTIHTSNKLMLQLASRYGDKNFFFLLGSGPNYATALEGALKLKEACNIFAEGFASREFLHGPIQLVDERTPVLFVATADEVSSSLSLISSLRNFGSPTISISEKRNKLDEVSTDVICIPNGFPKVFSPILYVVPLQLFAYYSSVVRGLNPDKPEKLTKVVK